MNWPVRHLPVVQNWDCHGCGECCREYQVTVTDTERERIESQGWADDPQYSGVPLFVKGGTCASRSIASMCEPIIRVFFWATTACARSMRSLAAMPSRWRAASIRTC